MQEVNTAYLKNIEALHEVPDDQLQWLIDESEHYEIAAEEFLFKPKDPLKGILIVIKGRLEIYMIRNNNKVPITELYTGAVSGTLPFSRAKEAVGYGLCLEDSQFMTLSTDKFKTLVEKHFELTEAMVHVMTSRVRDFTALQQQNEKMMALGKLSAGLAHELNNPASAIVRGAQSLKKHLLCLPDNFKQLISIGMHPEQVEGVHEKLLTLIERERPVLTMMQRSAAEDGMIEWLQEHASTESTEMAENFVDAGLTIDDLDVFKSSIGKENLLTVLDWINNNFITERMVNDIYEASKRIADLVGSVKNFTHMDSGGDKRFADIHAGIRNTLKMLNYKIKKANIAIEEDFDETLPEVKAMVGELNQVWTNLVDNAIDALEFQSEAKLTIKTRRDKEFVKVCITDNGPGIPEDIKAQVFDPFFTTKNIGKGTGLGLDVVNRIVKQHQGSIRFNSQPGNTTFEVCFPINA